MIRIRYDRLRDHFDRHLFLMDIWWWCFQTTDATNAEKFTPGCKIWNIMYASSAVYHRVSNVHIALINPSEKETWRHIKSKHLSFIILSWIKLQTFFNFRFPTKSLLLRIYIIYAYLDVSDVLKISFWEHLHMLLKEKFWYKFECAISLIIIYL